VDTEPTRTARRLRARDLWIKVHLYLALSIGAVVVLLGLTGSLLVFHPVIDRALNPELAVKPNGAPYVSADSAVAAVKRQSPGRPALVWMPRGDNATYVVELSEPGPAADLYRLVTVDAISGEVLAARTWGRTFVTFLFDLHTALLLGESGVTLVGYVGILLIVSILTGLYLWWPRAGQYRRAFQFRATRKALPLNFELHRLGGLYLSLVLLVIAVAGISIIFPSLLPASAGLFAEVTPEPERPSSAPVSSDARPLGLDAARQIARSFAPGGDIASIRIPRDRQDAYAVRFVDREEPQNRNGRSTVWIDQFNGRVLAAHAYSRLSSVDRYLALQLPFHDGEILGLPGRWLAFVAGIALAFLYGTGLYLWWKRRTPSRRLNPGA